MLRLDNLVPLVKKRKRVGRGGSRGGTSGKGHKGQNARSGGKVRVAFEGGQMPLYRRLPKRGFTNARFQTPTYIVNLDRLDTVCSAGDTVDKDFLIAKGVIKGHKSTCSFAIKVLGNGECTKKLIVHADSFSESAKKAIESAGGEVHTTKE